MAKPENLPLDLVSIRNEIIDVAYGRKDEVSTDIEKLYEWLKCDGWEELVALFDIAKFVIDIKSLTEYYDDKELACSIDIDIKDIDDSVRIKFVRDQIEWVFSTYDEYEVKSVCPIYFENDNKEGAYIYSYLECMGQGGDEVILWGGILKNIANFDEDIKKYDQFKLLEDCRNLTDQEILKFWHFKKKKSRR
jgi:hypothetical protein